MVTCEILANSIQPPGGQKSFLTQALIYLRRLTNLERSLDKESERAKAYYDTVDTYIAKGCARKLSPTEIAAKEPKNSRINITTFFNFPDVFRRYIRHVQCYIF